MNFFALIPLLAVFAYGGLVALVLRHPRRSERRAFTLYLSSAGLWSFASFLLRLDIPFLQQYTLTGSNVLILALIWMFLTYYHFVRVFAQKPMGREIYLGSGFLLIFAVLAGLGELPRDAYSAGGILYIDNGPALYLYALFGAGIAVSAAVVLTQHWRHVTTPLARARISYLLGGLAILTIGGLTNLSDTLSNYPVDHVGNLVNAAIISYAILTVPVAGHLAGDSQRARLLDPQCGRDCDVPSWSLLRPGPISQLVGIFQHGLRRGPGSDHCGGFRSPEEHRTGAGRQAVLSRYLRISPDADQFPQQPE